GTLQLRQLLLIGNARKLQAVNLFVLASHGIVRALEHRIPLNVTIMCAAVARRLARWEDRQRCEEYKDKNNRRSEDPFSGAHRVKIPLFAAATLDARF